MPIPLFEELCRKYLQQHGKESLIPPISQDSSRECEIFNVVEKRTKRKWILKSKIEYIVRELKIFDILDENVQMEDIECKEVEAGEWGFEIEHEHGLSFVTRWSNSILGLFKSSSHTHIANVKVVAVDIKKKNDFIKKLNNRKIKLDEQCIKDRKDNKSVMCVIIGVRKTKDVVEIKRTDGQKVNTLSDIKKNKVEQNAAKSQCTQEGETKIDANISGKTTIWSRVPENTTLAYKVLELKIDLKNGAIESRWNSIDEAGFFESKQKLAMKKPEEVHLHSGSGTSFSESLPDCAMKKPEEVPLHSGSGTSFSESLPDRASKLVPTDNEPCDIFSFDSKPLISTNTDASEFRHMQNQLEPLRKHLREDIIRSSLLQLMTCHNDVVLFSKMLDKAERGRLREVKNIYQQSNNKDALFKIFDLAGFKIESKDIVYEKEPTPILRAVAYIFDAMCDVDEKHLVKISQCSETQLKALEKIFKTVISSKMTMDVTIDNEIKSALKKPAKDILTDMDFGSRFYSWTISPPKTHTEVHECIYCILYCFS